MLIIWLTLRPMTFLRPGLPSIQMVSTSGKITVNNTRIANAAGNSHSLTVLNTDSAYAYIKTRGAWVRDRCSTLGQLWLCYGHYEIWPVSIDDCNLESTKLYLGKFGRQLMQASQWLDPLTCLHESKSECHTVRSFWLHSRTQTYLHTHSYTQTLLHRHFYTRRFYTRRFYTPTLLHTDAFTHRHFYTQTLLHTDAFTHRRFYTQTLLHTDAFTHRRFYTADAFTQTLLHTDPFTHRRFYTADPFTHRHLYTRTLFYTQVLLHTEPFTHRSFYTQ